MTQATPIQIDEAMLGRLLTEHLEVSPDLIRPDATFEELDLDSLAVLELVVVLEEQTGVELQENELGLGPSTTLAEAGRALSRMVEQTGGTDSACQENSR
ncbi:phosphopantetheine-binding protein [Streptomyces sp. NPDC047028]|uniref:phosphopantetheine-binding protein n=1 Tax=Streptomyces sp. NPDC047028 TaxID=3155793 RepID=UPI0033DEE73F